MYELWDICRGISQMSVEGENARKKADKMLKALHKYNSQILGDNLEDSIIERINNAKELKDILDKAREQQLKAKEDYLNNEN